MAEHAHSYAGGITSKLKTNLPFLTSVSRLVHPLTHQEQGTVILQQQGHRLATPLHLAT